MERQTIPLSLSISINLCHRLTKLYVVSVCHCVCVCLSLSLPQLINERKSPTKSTPLSFSFFHLSHSYLTSYMHICTHHKYCKPNNNILKIPTMPPLAFPSLFVRIDLIDLMFFSLYSTYYSIISIIRFSFTVSDSYPE